MRYVVEYTYGHGSYGSREFEAPATASLRSLELHAGRAVPNTATAIIKIEPKKVKVQ